MKGMARIAATWVMVSCTTAPFVKEGRGMNFPFVLLLSLSSTQKLVYVLAALRRVWPSNRSFFACRRE